MKKHVRAIIMGIVGVLLVVGYYYYLSNRDAKTAADNVELTNITKITTKNLDTSYPKTPRGVIKLYNDILTCYYNEECSEDEIEKLADQARKLMDDELAENNPKDQYYISVKADIQDYKNNERTISKTTVCDSDKITYKTVEDKNCAYVTASYFIKEGSSYKKSYQKYVLRQDDSGNWKILAYELTGGNGDTTENE